jgi:thiol-disulfide isomerase/thioredoxin
MSTWKYLAVVASLFLAFPVARAAQHALNDVSAVPHLNDRGRAGYREFLRAEQHRAFAVAPGGGWAWKAGRDSGEAAATAARDECDENSEQRCTVYAVDDHVVLDGRSWIQLWQPYLSAAEAAAAPEGTHRGERFYDLALTDPEGRPFRVSALRGKAVVLHFWGTWCPSCVRELPQLVKLQAATRSVPDLAWMFVPVREPVSASRQWLRSHGLALPLYDSGAQGGADDKQRLADGRIIADRALAPVFPTTYVLDRRGVVVFSMRGSATDWMQYIEFLNDVATRSGK